MIVCFVLLCIFLWSRRSYINRKQTVLVTGGSSGLGLALVNRLISRGHTVYILDIAEPPETLTGYAGNLVVDISSPECSLWISMFLVDKPRIDTLICNAGVFRFGSLLAMSESEIVSVFQTNVFGVMRCIKACQPNLKLYVISSEAVCLPQAACTWPYVASKRLLEDLAITLRLELTTLPTVTIVRPGAMQTPMLTGVVLKSDAVHKLTSLLARMWSSNPDDVAMKIVDSMEWVVSPDLLHIGHNPLLMLSRVFPAGIVRWVQGICMSMLS